MSSKQITIKLKRPHSGQAKIKKNLKRFNVISCGRRFGKTQLGIDLAIGMLLKGKPVGWFAPTYKFVTEVYTQIETTLFAVIKSANKTERRIELINGAVFECWTLDVQDIARGRKYARIFVDEAAMVSNLERQWNEAIRPTLADFKGDAFFLSTPKGYNYFYTLFLKELVDPEWKSFTAPTEANPYIDPVEVESMRKSLPEQTVKQEIDAAFLADGAGVFRRIRDCVYEGTRTYNPSHSYIMGVDWGRSNDFTVLTIFDVSTNEVVYIDRFTDVSYELQTQRLKQLAQMWNVQTILAESNSMGAPLVEGLQSDGLPIMPFWMSGESKTPLIETLQLAIERGEIRLPNDPILISELECYESIRLPSGKLRYSAPSNMHDDTVISLALAYHASQDFHSVIFTL